MFPKYEEIQIPLLCELRKRGGSSRPSEQNLEGKTIYESLADEFGLSEEAKAFQIYEADGTPRSKWNNMVRWKRNDLKKKELIDSPTHGVWQITDLGLAQIKVVENERVGASILDKELITSPENFEQQKKRNEEIGRLGENYVYQLEVLFLTESNRKDLADKVRMVCRENVAAGYDILSFTYKGNEKFIEVKTTVQQHNRFELTANELSMAETKGEDYWIYRVTKIEPDNPRVLKIQNPKQLSTENKLVLKPTSFLVTLGENFNT